MFKEVSQSIAYSLNCIPNLMQFTIIHHYLFSLNLCLINYNPLIQTSSLIFSHRIPHPSIITITFINPNPSHNKQNKPPISIKILQNSLIPLKTLQSRNIITMHHECDFNDDKIEEGFSSEEEFTPQQIVYTDNVKEKQEKLHKEEVKFKIPPAQEITDKKYSLRPDIVTGWQPKIQLPSPIPIIFQAPKYDSLIKRLIKKHSPKTKVCYLGPRYENTYFAWYNKPFTFPYNHMKSPHNIKFSDRQFCGQHWQAEEDLRFDSLFQSGNLDCAVKVGQFEYELFMRVDSNTRGHLQWFNFKIKNMEKDKEYTFHICNFQKKSILYARGLKPYVFSKQANAKEKIGWEQRGQNVVYEKKVGQTFKHLGIDSSKYYKLSFNLSTSYENDELQLAYCVPYTYNQMCEYLHRKNKQLQKSNRDILKLSKLCDSLGGLEVPLLIVHETHKQRTQSTANSDDEFTTIKRCVIICGRAHPGESNGSYMVEGFLDFICGDSKMAEFLRKHVIFKIVPMINPDGVALGNYRTGLSGRDFNREYRDPDKEVFPQVFAFKKLVTENKLIFKDNLSIFLDFHGHSTKKNTFAYGPQFPIVNKFYYESRILPKIIGNLTPMFRYYSCSFKVSQCKNTTARAVLLRKLNIPLAYTIEASNGFYFDYQKLKDVAYTDGKWKQMGEKVGQAIYEYMELVVKTDLLRHEKQKARKVVGKKETVVRKNGRSMSNNKGGINGKNTQGFGDKQAQSLILEGIEDEGIKHLFEQIRKAEQEKAKVLDEQKCSDDQMSQGSSDGEGQNDDLSKKHFSRLLNCIKNKKYKNIDKCKISPNKRTKTNDIDEDNEMQDKEKDTLKNGLGPSRMSQQVIVKARSHKADAKKEFMLSLMQAKKRSNTTKVVNFSFGFSFTPQKKLPQKNNMTTTKVNFFDTSHPSRQQSLRHESSSKLADTVMRKTFHSGVKQAKERQKQGTAHTRVNIFTTTTYVSKNTILHHKESSVNDDSRHQQQGVYYLPNRRNGRFDNHRLKKMAMDSMVGGGGG